MIREVNYLTVWVGHIPSVFPSIFADNVMVHRRNLEGRLHIILNDTFFPARKAGDEPRRESAPTPKTVG
jgi:hypothetical protein